VSACLDELAEWQQLKSEATKGTRPWKIYGEGPSTQTEQIASYQLSKAKFDSTDIRFTTKGEALYAIALAWPTAGRVVIKSLAANTKNYPGKIRKVELLGSQSELKWTRGVQGLEIQVPNAPPCKHAFAFRILAN
jgi:alpha-L-fucosidase